MSAGSIVIEYKEMLDKIRHYIHWKVCKYDEILNCEKWYKDQLELIAEAKSVALFWDFAIQTDRKIKNNRLDKVVKDYKRKTCLLIDMVVSTDSIISVKRI